MSEQRMFLTRCAKRVPLSSWIGLPMAVATVLVIAPQPASAGSLFINANFTPAFATDFGPNTAAAEAAFAAAAQIYTTNFVDPITINITVTAVTGTGTLGMSNTFYESQGWGTLQTALTNDAKSPADFIAIGAGGSINGADPTAGTGAWWVTTAQAKALGLLAGNDPATDGTITVGTGFTYTYDDSGGVAPGTFDLTDVFAHEISEVMGRAGLNGITFGGQPNSYTLLDAFSYQGAGARGLGNGGGNSFSINNGTNLLKAFNNQASNGGDSRDWASGTNDSYNAFSSSGVVNPVTALDLEEMDVLGFDSAAPEPASLGMLGCGLVAFGALSYRRRRASQ